MGSSYFSQWNKHRAIPITAVILLSVFFLTHLSQLAITWHTNSWSLQYIRAAEQPDMTAPSLDRLPESHYRGRVWLARDAVVAGNPQKAQAILDPINSIQDPQVVSALGAVLDAQGKTEAAIQAWTEAGDWRALYGAGNRALAENRGEDALAYREAVYRLNPEAGAEPLANTIWRVRQDAAAAADVLRQTLDAYPDAWQRINWLRRLGDFLRLQQAWDEAEAVYQEALKLNPRDSSTHVALGWLYYERDRNVEAALTQFEQAIALAPGNGGAYSSMGLVLTQEGRYNEADPWFAKALELEPNNRWWYRDRANAARSDGNLTLAIQVYREAVKRFPDFDYAYWELAWIYYLDGQYDEASRAIEHAIALTQGRNPNHWARAGMIYEKLNQPEQALAAYQKALQLAPDNPYARDGVDRLQGAISSSSANTDSSDTNR